ncbi:SPOR domain-containing protein [Campylobacter lanienae]|uniref:SPOR domain-containing protein n=1 Tax=Campylobacter lanienae TaxID=75658 RepID=UPI000BB4480A|nr:SPOR domain-containing protein [Campylobacter lanienae]
MEENNNLQDILLDKNEEEKSGSMRKILIGVALLVIIFVLVLIVMKFLNSDDKKNNNDIADALLLPTELPATSTPTNNTSNELFEQVPIVSDTTNSKDSFENIVNEYKNAQASMDTTTISPVLPPKVEEPFGPVEPKEIKKEPAKQEVAKNLEPKKVESKKPEVKKTETKKPDPKKAETKTDSVKTNVAQNSTSLAKGSYIQVASVSKLDTNSALIKKIIASGYKYKTHKVVVNGNEVIKILIGPFGADLESNMQKIRQDISNGAFVYRVK